MDREAARERSYPAAPGPTWAVTLGACLALSSCSPQPLLDLPDLLRAGGDGGAADLAAAPTGDAGGAQAQIYDDFEGAAINPALWQVIDPYGNPPQPSTATLDSTRAYRGRQSVKVQDGFLQAHPPGAAFYGRVWAWLSADPGPGHWEAWVGVGGTNPTTEVRYGGHYGILQANYYGNDDEVISDPKGYCAPTCANGVVPAVGKWSCYEFYFGKDEIRLWVDSAEVGPLHVAQWPHTAAPWSPAYDRVRVGLHNFGGATPAIWYDAVAFDVKRIGCQ